MLMEVSSGQPSMMRHALMHLGPSTEPTIAVTYSIGHDYSRSVATARDAWLS